MKSKGKQNPKEQVFNKPRRPYFYQDEASMPTYGMLSLSLVELLLLRHQEPTTKDGLFRFIEFF